jgi:HK97 family phage portal protein
MGFLLQFLQPEKRLTVSDLDTLMDRAVGGYPSAAGVDINDQSALSCVAVYAAVRLLSETMGSLPGHVMRQTEIGKEKALTHPLYPIIHEQPNPEQTAMEWRETAMCHLLLRGNHYSEKQYDNAGRLMALWPIHPDRVTIERPSPQAPLIYHIKIPDGSEVRLSPDRVLHLRGMGSNGVTGFSPIAVARQAIGLAIAAQEYGARLFKNDTRPGGVLEHPQKLSDPAYARLRASIENEHQGLSNAHRMMILEEGMKWSQVGINPDDAQFLESRKFSVAEIARIFNIPPHFLRDLERATFSNIEQQAIEFVMYSLRPWCVRLEQRLKIELLSAQDRVTHFLKFNVDGLLRGDIAARYNSYHVAKQDGWLNADEIRELEDMNPIPGGKGADYWQPVNIGIVGKMPQVDAAQNPASQEQDEEPQLTR